MGADRPLALGYARVSTEEQAKGGWSIGGQRKDLERWAKKEGYRLELFVDKGISGSVPLPNRPRGSALLEAIPAAAAVVFSKQDRITRSGKGEWQWLRGLCEDHGTRLISLTESHVGNSPLTEDVVAAISAEEIRNGSARTKLGLRARAEAGFWPHGSPPYGYRAIPRFDAATGEQIIEKGRPLYEKVWGTVAAEAQIIERIDRDYLEGQPINRIAAALNREGVPPPSITRPGRQNGRRNPHTGTTPVWSGAVIAAILDRPLYSGIIEFQGITATADPAFPRLRGVETYEAIRDARSRRRRPGRRAGIVGPFTGILRCTGCLGSMQIKRWELRQKPGTYSGGYRCSRFNQTGTCPRPAYAPDRLVKDAIAAGIVALVADKTAVLADQHADQIERWETALARIDVERTRAITAYEAGLYTVEEFEVRTAAHQERKAEAEGALVALAANPDDRGRRLADALVEMIPITWHVADVEDVAAIAQPNVARIAALFTEADWRRIAHQHIDHIDVEGRDPANVQVTWRG